MLTKTILKYTTGLVAVYLLVSYATGSGTLISNTTGGAVNVIKALQGRS